MNPADISSLTLDQLYRLKDEVVEAERQIAEKRDVVNAAIQQLVSRLGLPMPAPAAAQVAPPAPPKMWGKPSWTVVVQNIMDAADRGLNPGEVYAAARATEVASMLPRGIKNCYNAINRLRDKGKIKRVNGLLYTPKLHAELTGRGVRLPKAFRVRAGGNSIELVIEVLKAHPKGLTFEQLREKLTQLPNCTSGILNSRGYIHTYVLKPMAKRGQIVQARDNYRLAPETAKGKKAAGRPALQATLLGNDSDVSSVH